MDYSRRHFLSAGTLLTASTALPLALSAGKAQNGQNFSGMLNVRDFGAKGDGATDDTAPIQKSLDQAAKTNGSVFIPEGNYLCSELKVRKGRGFTDFRPGAIVKEWALF